MRAHKAVAALQNLQNARIDGRVKDRAIPFPRGDFENGIPLARLRLPAAADLLKTGENGRIEVGLLDGRTAVAWRRRRTAARQNADDLFDERILIA